MRPHPSDGYESIPSSDRYSDSQSTESHHSYESQTAVAYIKGNLGCVAVANPHADNLDSVVVVDNFHTEGEESDTALSRSDEAMATGSNLGSVVVENPHAIGGERGEATVARNLSCVVVDNPHAEEGEGSEATAAGNLSSVVVDNPHTEVLEEQVSLAEQVCDIEHDCTNCFDRHPSAHSSIVCAPFSVYLVPLNN